MKKYILWSLLLLVAGVFCCLDMRTLRLAKILESYNHKSFFKFEKSDLYDKLPDDERDRKIVEAYFSLPEGYKSLDGLINDNYAWLSAYAWELCRQGLTRDKNADMKLAEILSKLRKLDPDNGCPDYIESEVYYQKAVKYEFSGNKFEKKLLDRQALDKAAYFYMQAVNKPYVKIYNSDRIKHIISSLALRNDPLGTVQQMSVSGMMLFPQLNAIRELAYMAIFYAELLDKEGKKAESRRVLRSGRDFVIHWAKDNTDTLLEYLVYEALISIFYESAQRLNDSEMIALCSKAAEDFQQWKSQEDKSTLLAMRYGGYFSSMILPALRTEIPVEAFTPERKLTYLVCDRLALTGFAVVCILIVFYLAAVAVIGKICRKDLVLMKFPLRTWFNIVGLGMLLPIVIYLIFSRIDAIGGRNLSIYANKIGFLGGLALLVFMWLWLEVTLRIEIKKTGKINFVSNSFNRILPYAIMLLFVGVILGTWFDIEEKYYCQREKLFHPVEVFNHIEHNVAHERAAKMVKLLQEK